jgi:pimeloyl-ACP methyl ester carboxylesterase
MQSMHTESSRLALTGPHGEREELALRLATTEGDVSEVAVLYCHGFGSSQSGEKADFFRPRFVEAGFAFCSFDFRGHGESGGSSLDLTLTRNLVDISAVEKFLVERGAKRLILFGSSMGGLTALWHAALEPTRCAAGVAIAPALGFGNSLDQLLGREAMGRWRRDGQMHFVTEVSELDVGWEMVEDLRRYSESELGAQLQTPFLFFQGKLDDRVDWHIVQAFAQQRPDLLRCELFDEGDHRLIDWLDLVWRHSLDFIERTLHEAGQESPA